ncbi:MAG: hypothetical protein ACTSUC_04000 [Promethearchaeota archaeon]
MSSIPDRLYIEDSDKKLYDKLLEKGSPLSRENGFENKDIFMLALSTGYDLGTPLQIKKRLGYFLAKYLSREDEAILYSIAVKEKGIDALKDIKTVYNLAEEYANNGIKSLYENVFSGQYGAYQKRLETDLIKKIQKVKS